MMFGDNGVFKSEIQFEKKDQELSSEEVSTLLKYNIARAFTNAWGAFQKMNANINSIEEDEKEDKKK